VTPSQQSSDRNALVLALLRIAVGLLFLIFGEYKIFGSAFVHQDFERWVSGFIVAGAYPFAVPVLKSVVLPHAHFFAWVVGCGEFAIGLALVTGVLLRVASAFGFTYMLILLFSSNYPGPGSAFWQYFGASLDHSVLALCFLAFLFGHADQRLTLRGVWLRRTAGSR
jgi:thiosulfate dehydrogenase [quinone] large subunit